MRRRHVIAALALAPLAGVALAQGKKGSTASDGIERMFNIAGRYRSNGRNADGSAYSGDVEIVQQGDAIEMTWTIQGDTIRGRGVIEGRIVTVDWGDTTPVIYVAMPDGELHGTWADGAALEKLTPR